MSTDVVTGFEASMRADLITPRGLVNNGNMCFMNAVRCFVYNIRHFTTLLSLHCFPHFACIAYSRYCNRWPIVHLFITC